ncbi:MAG: hypothetical protein K6B64_00610 [Acholeplasmatales bacterium]|nr:hypothetical protein [Acholeplasmatales bacterium]
MKKKIIALMFLILTALPILASCEVDWTKKDPLHIHTYVNEVVAPTCEERGYTLQTCKECGYQVKIKYTDALGHDEEVIPAVNKTCTKDGLTEGIKCSRCNKILKEQEVVPASHNWKYTYALAPTCEMAGTSSGKECLDCGEKVFTPEVIPALGHHYEAVEEKTSCGHTHTKHECENCHDVYYDNLVVDYTKNYDYKQFQSESSYAEYKETFALWYQELYDDCMAVLSSTETYDENSIIADTTYISIDENVASAFVSSFMNNNPQFYFLSNGYSFRSNSVTGKKQVCLKIDPDYFTASARNLANQNILRIEQEFSRLALEENNQKDVAKALHDYLAENTYYEWVSEGVASKETHAHNIIGIFDNDSSTGSVCEGYSNAYLYLSHLVGLNSIMVVGTVNGGGHAWNYTEINSNWYGVDITWDDQDSQLYHDFFLACKNDMEHGTSHFEGIHVVGNSVLEDFGDLNPFFQVILPTLSSTRGYALV